MSAGYATQWRHRPHVRVGDPCYWCGIPMVPASREWPAMVIPDGHRKHGGLGLCQRCARRRRVGELIDDGDELREA